MQLLCGIEADKLGGVALKFSRSAMSVIHPQRTASTIGWRAGCWAWMAIHAVTANLLRPGGLYKCSAIDLFPVLSQMHRPGTDHQITGHPLMLMQAPATAMTDEIRGEVHPWSASAATRRSTPAAQGTTRRSRLGCSSASAPRMNRLGGRLGPRRTPLGASQPLPARQHHASP